MSESEAMEIDTTAPPADRPEESKVPDNIDEEETEEEQCADLLELLESTDDDAVSAETKIQTLSSILTEPQNRYGPTASSIKERAIYGLARAYCNSGKYDSVVDLLTGSDCSAFFENVTKAKCAKVVRAVLDVVCTLAPDQLDMQAQICRNIITWCQAEKRTFLRQRVEAKLASVLFEQDQYGPALELVDNLLVELKKLDDKQLLGKISPRVNIL